jgi:hypothetical protein
MEVNQVENNESTDNSYQQVNQQQVEAEKRYRQELLKAPFAKFLFPVQEHLRNLFSSQSGQALLAYLRAERDINRDTLVYRSKVRDIGGHVVEDNSEQLRGRIRHTEEFLMMVESLYDARTMKEYTEQVVRAKEEAAQPGTYTQL